MKNKHDVIVRAVKSLKDGDFHATAIKVELEAQFNRRSSGFECTCPDCRDDETMVRCPDCDGDEGVYCEMCSDGWRHYTCEEVECEEPDDDCDHDVSCDECDDGWIPCETCDGEGVVEAEEGESDEHQVRPNWGSTLTCYEWLMERLEPLGLSEKREDDRWYNGNDTSVWRPKLPLSYARFYNDGSVDSEFTFTLMLDDESVFTLPKIVELFDQLGKEIGQPVDLRRAGMHMAVLNDPEGFYEEYQDRLYANHDICFANFRKSMQLLMPALFFLGSSDEKSRELSFRVPRVESDEKYSAIHAMQRALEFRVFNTCYDNPEAILDNLVVISNCMKFWRADYKPHGLAKITTSCHFGNENNDKLERFYKTREHIDLLNRGLERLKPTYYTIGELKKQRNFAVTKHKIKDGTEQVKKMAELEYKEYEERFSWSMLVRKNNNRANLIERRMYNLSPQEVLEADRDAILADVEQELTRYMEDEEQRKKPLDRFIREKVEEFQKQVGRYRLQERS